MDSQICPHCNTRVVVTAAGTCPSCRSVLPKEIESLGKSEAALSRFDNISDANTATDNPSPDEYVPREFKSSLDRWMWILFSFNGRIPRRDFWAAEILHAMTLYLFTIIADYCFPKPSWIAIACLYSPWIWVSFAVSVKRWHDRDKSGWWTLIRFIPLVGAIWELIELGFLRGTGFNQYGPEPTLSISTNHIFGIGALIIEWIVVSEVLGIAGTQLEQVLLWVLLAPFSYGVGASLGGCVAAARCSPPQPGLEKW